MTALRRLSDACADSGLIPWLGDGVPLTPAELMRHVTAREPLTDAQLHYLTRLNFILNLELLAEIDRLRQLVLNNESPGGERKDGAELDMDAPSFSRIPNPDTAAS